tara:strand:+ start:1841 stop:2335 length:495 start_codon:yes stop_codon:yes gene_type:complete
MVKEKKESKEKISKDKSKNKDKNKTKELTESLQRLQAEFENYKKRTDKQNQEFTKYSNKELILKLLPLLDNFDLALKNTENHEDFVKGVELIFAQFVEVLEKQGLHKIDSVGKVFNPHIHEALMQDKNENKKDNEIVEEFQTGYTLNDQVIRNSKVKVNKTGGK